MMTTTMLKDETSFTASTDDVQISRPAILRELVLSMKVASTTGTSVAESSILPLVQPFELKRNGSAIISIRGDDLYALNTYLLGVRPVSFATSTTTAQSGRVMGLRIPVNYPAGMDVLTYKVTRVAVSVADTETISLLARFSGASPETGWYEFTTFNYTASATGALGLAVDTTNGGKCIGILLFGTTVPTAAANSPTINKLQVKVDGEIKYDENWETLRRVPTAGGISGTSVPEAILDNYVMLDLRDEPIDAGKRIEIFTNAATADAARIIPIFMH